MTLLEKLRRAFGSKPSVAEKMAERAAFPALVAQTLRAEPGVLAAEPSGEFGVRVAISQGLTFELDLTTRWKELGDLDPGDQAEQVRGAFATCMRATPPLDMAGFTAFEASLEQLPWFENLGRPLDADVPRLASFEDWTGPYSDEAEWMGNATSGWRREILGAADRWHPLAALFERIEVPVFLRCSRKLGDDPPGESEVPPRFAAAALASWSAALVGLCIACRRKMPSELAAAWEWFRKGHWPAEAVFGDGEVEPQYRVY